jgi:parallel beta-helix repeat protein
VDVDTQLTIRSENGAASTTVNALYSNDHVFEVTADYVRISGFTVEGATGGGEAGIYLGSNVDHCNIYDNNASGNCYGIYLHSSSTNNLIYNNYFNNTNNAQDDGTNIWDITPTLGDNIIGGSWLGGNYWSDYAGEDTNGDGLGDTLLPYNASGEIITGGDWHPLVQEPSPCFIATAAYGTPLHEDINVLRKFRDEYMMPNPAGQAMVKIYYTTSPPIADMIRANEGLRITVRDGLVNPLVEVTRRLVE